MTEQTNLVPKRRFKEFENTSDWKQSMLGDVIEGLYNGQTPSRFRSDFWNGDINWLTSGELNRSIVKTTIEKITMAGQTDANLRIVPKNTFVLAITGLEAAGTRGNCGILGVDTTLNQSCMALYPNKELLSTQFLFQWYKLVGEGYGLRYTQGTKQQSYNAEIIKNLEICLPQVKEQKKIGRFFKHLDHLITLQQRKLEKTKALKSAYLSEMFPAEGESEPKRRFVGFTQAWEQRKFDEEVEFYSGLTYSPQDVSQSGTFVLRSSNVKNGEIVNADNVFVKSEIVNSSNVQEGDIVVVVRNGSRSLIGKHAQIKKDMDKTVIGAFMTGIRSQQSNFINALLDTHAFKAEVDKNLGATINQITNGMFRNMYFMFPESEEQKEIGNFFAQIDQLIIIHQRKLEKLQNLKKAHLHEMFV